MRNFVFNKHYSLSMFTLGVVIGALFLVASQVSAIFVSSPTDPINPGDITTTEIADDTILNADVASTSAIDAYKIFPGAAGGSVLIQSFGRIASTSALNVATTTNRTGVATTTPGATLSVQGNALVSGTLSTGKLVATSTTKLNGVEYTWPSQDGSAGDVFSTNGAGQISFIAAGSWKQCGETYASVATTSITVSNLAAKDYAFSLFVTALSGATNPAMRFNNDAGPNYGGITVTNGVANSANNADNLFYLEQVGANVVERGLWGTVNNATSTRKFAQWSGFTGNATGDTAPSRIEGTAVWDNSTTSISSIRVSSAAETMAAGSRLTVYCSAD